MEYVNGSCDDAHSLCITITKLLNGINLFCLCSRHFFTHPWKISFCFLRSFFITFNEKKSFSFSFYFIPLYCICFCSYLFQTFLSVGPSLSFFKLPCFKALNKWPRLFIKETCTHSQEKKVFHFNVAIEFWIHFLFKNYNSCSFILILIFK